MGTLRKWLIILIREAVRAEMEDHFRSIETKLAFPPPRTLQESFDRYPQRMSGAALRRMNEKYNAQVAREQEPKSVSEILKEQVNG